MDQKLASGKDYKGNELSDFAHKVVAQKATEPPFSGIYADHHDQGMYKCVVCGQDLFSSDTKFESGSGWPSFYDAVDKSHIKFTQDFSQGMNRVEVSCANCGAHLGHVFPDGPTDKTGQRYCINSVSLAFEPKKPDGN